jgi:hypothetical protein
VQPVPGNHDDLLTAYEPHDVVSGIAVIAPERFIQRYEPEIYYAAKIRERQLSRVQIGTFFFMCAIGFGIMAFIVGLVLRLHNLSGI